MNSDITPIILKYCKFLPLRLVCKEWNDIIKKFPVESSGNYTTPLNIVSYNCNKSNDMEHLNKLTNLTKLDLDHIDSDVYINLTKLTHLTCECVYGVSFNCPNLTYLDINFCDAKFELDNLTTFNNGEYCKVKDEDIENLTKLTHLEIHDDGIGNRGLRNLTNLTKLVIGNNDEITNINHLVNLEFLELYGYNSVIFYRDNFPNLTHLDRG